MSNLNQHRVQESDIHDCVRKCHIIPSGEIIKVKRLGAGSFGEVTLGEWLGSPVALKTLNEQNGSADLSGSSTKEFLKELRLLADLSHSKIVRFLGVCASPPCIVLDFYSHGSLDNVLHVQKAAITYGQVLSIAQDVALGMRFLHHRDILHRDLKPQNILIDKGLGARIADFGLAKTLVKTGVSEEGLTGTVPYMAPEILARQPYSFPVDVYAFAILLNEMIASERPYDGNEVDAVVHAVLSLDKRPTMGSCTPSMTKMIQDCWKKRASDRPTFPHIVSDLKGMIDETHKAKLVANSLLSTVSKLVSYLSSKFLFEKEEALHKLRDMMDYGQDLYNVGEVQEAFHLAKGVRCVSELLETLSFDREGNDSQQSHAFAISACDLICNACHSNETCKAEARACRIPEALLRLAQQSQSQATFRHVVKTLKVISQEDHENCQVLYSCNIFEIAADSLEKHRPMFDQQTDLEEWFQRHPTLTTWGSLPEHIPGLQEEDEANELANSRSPATWSGRPRGDQSRDVSETEMCESLLCLLNNMHKEGFLLEESSRRSWLSLLFSYLLHPSQTVRMQARILLEMLLREGGTELTQVMDHIPMSVLLQDTLNHGLLLSLGQLVLGHIFHQASVVSSSLHLRLSRFMLHCNLEHPGMEDNWKLLISALQHPPSAQDFAESDDGLSSLLRLKKKNACSLIPTVLVFAASLCPQEKVKPWHAEIRENMLICLEHTFYKMDKSHQDLTLHSFLRLGRSSSEVSSLYPHPAFRTFVEENAQTFPDSIAQLLYAASSTVKTFGSDVHSNKWMPRLLDLLARVEDSSSLACLCEMMWAALDQEEECRVDFAAEQGSQPLILLLARREVNIRLFAAACIRAACMNCPESRQDLHEAQGIKHLLDFLRREQSDEPQDSAATEHALAAINNACCSHVGNCQDVHANEGMLVLTALLNRQLGPKVREYAALAIVNTCSSAREEGGGWKEPARKALQELMEDESATDKAKRFAAWSLKNILLK